jgi:signal transduction histidine kinase
MRERVTELGGTLALEPCRPHGTRITARLPAPEPVRFLAQEQP